MIRQWLSSSHERDPAKMKGRREDAVPASMFHSKMLNVDIETNREVKCLAFDYLEWLENCGTLTYKSFRVEVCRSGLI